MKKKFYDIEVVTTIFLGGFLFMIILITFLGCSNPEPTPPPVDLRKYNDSVMNVGDTFTTLPIAEEMEVAKKFDSLKK